MTAAIAQRIFVKAHRCPLVAKYLELTLLRTQKIKSLISSVANKLSELFLEIVQTSPFRDRRW